MCLNMFIIYVFVIVSEGLILLTANRFCYFQEVNHIQFFLLAVMDSVHSTFYFIDNCVGLDTLSNCKDFSYL